MLTLYGRRDSSNTAKVLWLLDELALPFDFVLTGGKFGGNDNNEFLQMNPFGKVPVIRHGDVIVWESNAVLRYLANLQDSGPLWPQAAGEAAKIDRWMDWSSISVTPPLTRLRKAMKAGTANDAARQSVMAPFAQVNAWLGNNRYLAGEHLTLADMTFAPSAYRYCLLQDKVSLPNLETYVERLNENEAYRRHISGALT
ncbi:glutathione S-transferase [Neorhizobium galegae]|uniref:glutathione S-transferase family protein n=1 Tax=Neorhizobium galegae TaxID=399 RepID=UPI001AEB493E|nr:glutathione S-transferase family protein [Neorhizobium galegae]MBP2557282.1 glutathione S-transferase [Neorhizobium galegae]MDQ0138262.1 glutathione S-transferase [Neorhizobium galegae]